jgi:hypothetical protein
LKTTARFEIERQQQLAAIFTRERLVRVWRDLVRQQLRQQAIVDLHDYYDFNFTIEAQADAIIERVLNGQYRAEVPVIYKLEKKLGICRHMMVPSPSDALVFQVLADAIYDELVKVQPSKQAYYARDRHSLKLPHELAEEQRYPWFKLWPKFQSKIWGFSKSFPMLVTTDLTNYFDNIGFEELRRVIASLAPSTEVLLDLLFTLIQDLAWNPDYLPRTPRGLPVIEIEAPRLLAHSFLFEVDRILKDRTADNFVRWMDDINFGVKRVDDAHRILGDVNDVLKSRGLALNLGKTEILSSKEVVHHFMVRENQRIAKQFKRAEKLKSPGARERFAQRVYPEFVRHAATCEARNKDKLTKRFLTLFSRLSSGVAIDEAVENFVSTPGLRESSVRYISRLPFSRQTARAFRRLLMSAPRYDDLTLLLLVRGIVEHKVPRNAAGRRFVSSVKGYLGAPSTPFDWYARLLFLAKYGAPHEILTDVEKARSVIRRDSFLGRQAMAVLARSVGINLAKVTRSWQQEVSRGATDSASVAVNLMGFLERGFPAKANRAYSYLFPKDARSRYPLSKSLLLCVIAISERQAGKVAPRPEVAKFVDDEWLRAAIKAINPAWFREVGKA